MLKIEKNDKLGIDIGGVLCTLGLNTHGQAFREDGYLEKPFLPDAIETISMLRGCFPDIYLISFCGKNTAEKTRQWLDYQKFWQRSGIQAGNVRFVRKRTLKAPLCRELCINHFIDDRLEILNTMSFMRMRILFHEGYAGELKPGIVLAKSWYQVGVLYGLR